MDRHDVSHNRGSYAEALGQLTQPALIVAIASDLLYPPIEQQELANLIPHAQLATLSSPHGHDGFLIDMDDLNDQVVTFRQQLADQAAIAPASWR